MTVNLVILAVAVYLLSKYAKRNAWQVKNENKALENTYNALLDRKAFAQEAQEQDKDTYLQAVKLIKRG